MQEIHGWALRESNPKRSGASVPSAAKARPLSTEGEIMSSVARITTLNVRSETSFEDAVKVGIERAHQTLRGITGAWVKEQKVEATDGNITAWSVVLEVTFVLED
jgi:flavin-binding protein dodecin